MDAGGYVLPRGFEGPEFAPFPGYIQTPAQRRRWTVCARIVSLLSARFEPTGRPDSRFVWVGTRALYNSDTPTGSDGQTVEEAAAELHEAVSTPPETPYEVDVRLEMAVALIEEVLGPLEEYGPELEEEATALPALGGSFQERLHPRSRLGKWIQKFGAVKRITTRPGFQEKVEALKAGADTLKTGAHVHKQEKVGRAQQAVKSAKAEAKEAGEKAEKDVKGGAASKLHSAMLWDPEEKVADAVRPGLKRAKGESKAAWMKRIASIAPLFALAWEVDPRHETDLSGVAAEDAFILGHTASHLVSWAVEHAEELRMLGQLARQLAQVTGLAAAEEWEDDGDPDEMLVEAVLG